jgi:anion-transporting  ArsA/GET3 family ATPase
MKTSPRHPRVTYLQEVNRLYGQAIEEVNKLITQVESGRISEIDAVRTQTILDQVSKIELVDQSKELQQEADPEIEKLESAVRQTGIRLVQLAKDAEARADSLKNSLARQMQDLSQGLRMNRAYAQTVAANKGFPNY